MSSDARAPRPVHGHRAAARRSAGRQGTRVVRGPADGRRLFVTTDRLSAFDRIIAGIPYKGQVLNELAAWWFERTAGIIGNHVIDVPDPNVLVATATDPARPSRWSSGVRSPA